MTPILDAAEIIFLGNKYIPCFFSQFATKLPVMCSYVLARKEKLQSTSNACQHYRLILASVK